MRSHSVVWASDCSSVNEGGWTRWPLMLHPVLQDKGLSRAWVLSPPPHPAVWLVLFLSICFDYRKLITSHTVYQQHCTASGKRCARLLLISSATLTESRWVCCQLLVCRHCPLSSCLVTEWEAAGNISKCTLTFNYTKISFRDHFPCQPVSDLLKHFPFYVDSFYFPQFWMRSVGNEPPHNLVPSLF